MRKRGAAAAGLETKAPAPQAVSARRFVQRLHARYVAPTLNTTAAIRIAWNAVTMGTPSRNAFAVSAISPMPPGVVATIAVDQCSPEPTDSSQPNTAATTRYTSVIAATAPRKRGADSKNSGVKRVPSPMPISSCPALTTGAGSDDQVRPIDVTTAAASKGPIIQLFGEPTRRMTSAAPPVMAANRANPAHEKSRAIGT